MMFRFCILIFWALCIAGCDRSSDAPPPAPVVTQAPEPPPPPPEPDLVVDRLLIWEVSPAGKPGVKSHLVGTYHLGTDFHGVVELPEPGRSAFQSARVVVLEADLGLVDPELDKMMIIDGPRTLDAMLTPEQWDAALQHTGLPPLRLKRLRPHTVLAELAKNWTPGAGVRGMDGRFRILAKAYDKKLAYLETPHQQVELLADAVTVEMLAETLDRADEEKERSATLLEAFKAGNTAPLEAQLFAPEDVKEHSDFYEKVFWVRNRAWVERLKPYLDEGGAFVAVGAGHLIGEQNLRELLSAEGYDVREASP